MSENETINSSSSSVEFADEAVAAFRQFGTYANARALPNVRDGLKLGQRRIIWSFNDNNAVPGKREVKGAIAASAAMNYHPHGDCLDYNTRFFGIDGEEHKIGELFESGVQELQVLGIKDGALVPVVAHSFRIGQHASKVYKVILSDGSSVTATGNHPFAIIEQGSLKRLWVKTEDLVPGQLLDLARVGGSIAAGTFPTITRPADGQRITPHKDFLNMKQPDAEDFGRVPSEDVDYQSIRDTISTLVYTGNIDPLSLKESGGILGNAVWVADVEIVELSEPVAMYDFTVTGTENAFIIPDGVHRDLTNGYSIILTHNSALYDTIANMAHNPDDGLPVRMIAPPVRGIGSWGDLDNGPASSRYTECQLNRFGMYLLGSIDADTHMEIKENAIPTFLNYSGEFEEPEYLPALVPNFVINGVTVAIGTGISSRAPQHNPIEALELAIKLIQTPSYLSGNITENRMEIIRRIMPGPDFPCKAVIYNDGGVEDYYKTGFGSFIMRGVYETRTEGKNNVIEFTGFPYQVSPTMVIEGINTLIANGSLPEHWKAINASDSNGDSLIINIGKDDFDEALNSLFFYGRTTRLQTSFSSFTYALVDGEIKSVGTIDMLGHWIHHRQEVVRNRSKFRLNKAEDRLEVVEAYLRAIPIAQELVELIRKSENRAEASQKISKKWDFSERQAKVILDMTVGQITKLGVGQYENERDGLLEVIDDCKRLLSDSDFLNERIISECRKIIDDLKPEFSERRCEVRDETVETYRPEVSGPPAVPGILVATDGGYIRWAKTRGVSMSVGTEYVTRFENITNQDYIDAISDTGWQYRVLADELPERMAKIGSMFPLDQGEDIVWFGMSPAEGQLTVLLTNTGGIKLISSEEFNNVRIKKIDNNKGYKALIGLTDDERIIKAVRLDPHETDLGILTAYGNFHRIDLADWATKGRSAKSIPGVRLLADNDSIVWAGEWGASSLLYWTELGNVGKIHSSMTDYVNRNTKGKPITTTNTLITGARAVFDDQELENGALTLFNPSGDEELVLIDIEELKANPKTTDRTLAKIQEPLLNKVNSIWIS